MKAYLTSIGLELDNKADQIVAYLYFRPLYHILSYNWPTYPRKILGLFKVLEKRYIKLIGNDIYELKFKPAFIIALWWQSPTINVSNSKNNVATQLIPSLKTAFRNSSLHRWK